MRLSKNYREGKVPPLLSEYDGYSFSFKRPDYDINGKPIAHRILPDDDTPRVFKNCNLVNACPPPGSIIIDCNTSIVRIERREEVVDIVNDKRSDQPEYFDMVYGRTNPTTLDPEYKETPLKIPAKEVM